MPEYIVRARKAPTDPGRFRAAVGSHAHVEYLSQIIINTLFVSKGHRRDTDLTLVLEQSGDYSRAISFPGQSLGSLMDLSESGLLNIIAECLEQSSGLEKDEQRTLANGLRVQAISFEHLVRGKLDAHPVFLLDKKGDDIRGVELAHNAVFLLTDHIPMPKKTFKSLNRQGVRKISLGPVILHASQCVVLIQNEYDRRSY